MAEPHRPDGRKLLFGTGWKSWKVRHISGNLHVLLTIPVVKRVLLTPWIKVPVATISFAGTARVLPDAEATPELLRMVCRQLADDDAFMAGNCLVEVTPVGEFITYAVGAPLMQMRYPEKSCGCALLGPSADAPAIQEAT